MTIVSEIAKSWILLQTSQKDSFEYDDNFWALEKLMELCEADPLQAFEIIEEIIRQDSTEAVLARLAAGPMEDLLAQHGAKFIDRIEQSAVADSRFRKMLGVVWKAHIPDEIWDRIEKVSGPTF